MDLDLIALGDQIHPDAETQNHWRRLPTVVAAQRAPDQLILPHPRLAERGFVLMPLADIAADWVHPLTGQSVVQMLSALPEDALAGISVVAPPDGALPSSEITIR